MTRPDEGRTTPTRSPFQPPLAAQSFCDDHGILSILTIVLPF
jgi:hypothetical protein